MTTIRTRTRQAGPTREDLARTVARAAGVAAVCLCPGGPTTVATWRREQLVDVELRHLRTDGCGLPATHVDLAEWLRTPARRRR